VRTWSLAQLGIPRAEVGLTAAATVTRTVTPQGRRRAGGVIRYDGQGVQRGLVDFLVERHLL